MTKPWYRRIYALYKGESFITEGTIEEIHVETNKSIDFLRYMTFPVYEKRCGNSTKRLRMVPIDD
ncbi:hypothetical protein JC777_00905 [Bacillus cytotoxicus]|uniref:A0A073K4L1 (Uncharacterized protein) n=1 Tax=Bacillus cytotoxicus TaxID=580165 RepID=A0AAX2CKA3_9BACI|nr:hypothetical protein [Bacillus cytotoxicus]QTR85179.1 hypothetical protein JC777_00905 [Bacillus cytotoxicus]QTR89207.1 hypothetical protein JC774_20920 [Bacillus cytotoxicus]SCM00554.1 A0A073K4L1 (Uncharacterized protein) [Bacillus cytotoxicus]